jgi:hypothetical protein
MTSEHPKFRGTDWIALLGAAATVALNFVVAAGKRNAVFIVGACLFWVIFVAVRARQDKHVFRDWGFRSDNLWQSAFLSAALFVVIAAALAAYAHFHDTLRFPVHALCLFPIYPI